MMKQHKTAIILAFFLFAMMVLSALNLYFLLENINTREDRIRQSVEQVLQEVKQRTALEPVSAVPPQLPATDIQYIKGADGQKGLDGMSIKGDKGDKGDTGMPGKDGKDGKDGLTIELRCNTVKNRWESKYSIDKNWTIMNNSITKCVYDDVLEAMEIE